MPVSRDPDRFSIVRQLWDLMLSGTYSPNQIHKIAIFRFGLRTLKRKRIGGGPLALSTLYSLFTNRFYAGIIEWEGKLYPGKHEPMVKLEEFDRVQQILDRDDRPRPKIHTFSYTGLIRCGECGQRFVRKDILDKFNFISTNTGALICFLLFLLPGFPKDVLCYILGLTGMRLSTFLIVSTLGRMPGTYLLTIQGASLRSQDYTTAVLIAVISVALVVLGYLYKDHFVHRMKSKAG